MTRYETLADAVGGTPLIRLTRLAASVRPRVYVKVESSNPAGSVKDRAALWMLRAARANGSLPPGGTVVETTSGNTGIGLAAFAAHLGYRSVIFTSSAVSAEKRALLSAYGAEVRLVDSFVPKSHPDSLRSVAERFVTQTPGAWLADQYDNPANPEAHRATTGPEIWQDTEGRVTHLVATVGTGGTISGTGGYLKEVSGGRVTVVGADPLTSSYSGGDGSQKYVEGAGHFVHPEAVDDIWPQSLDTAVIDRYVAVDDRSAIDAIRRLAVTEGILAGGSSGVALAAALDVARDLAEDDVVVAILPDSGRAYLSTYFNDQWLVANGFRDDESAEVTLRSLIPADRRPLLVSRDELAGRALAALAGAGDTDPVLVVYRRDRELPPHPSEVVGWTTAKALREAADDLTVAQVSLPAPPRVGIGASAASALEAAHEADPLWTAVLVLEDGRAAGILARDELEARAAASGPPARAAIDGFVEIVL